MTYPWNAGEVLSASDLNAEFASKVDYALPTNAQTGTAYTFVAADAEKLTTASNGSAVTLTVPPASSVAWPDNTVLRVVNYGAGAVTVAGGSGVTVTNTASTLDQYQAGAAIRTGSDAWTFVPFSGGAGDADFSNSATGTYTDTGVDYKYVTFTSSGTLTVTQEGVLDLFIVGGGGSGGSGSGRGGGGGAVLYLPQYLFTAGSYTVTVGAGGASNGAGDRGGNGGNTSSVSAISTEVFSMRGGSGGTDLSGGSESGGNVASSITGTSITYSVPGPGATGSGAGTANRGNGGQGGTGGGGAGGNGGSGVVIVRVRTN